jgi:trehalose 6-phosphate phosphatase
MGTPLKAVILDMDGVITQTATFHARAWKEMFDRYNQRRKNKGKNTFADFDIVEDYPEHLDGVPRYEGVVAFLNSREIKLSYGSEDDEPGEETVCGLGNWKNELFHEYLKREGVEVYEDAVEKVKEWKQKGLKTALISSSKNSKLALESAGLTHLFDVCIDGIVSIKRNLKGKPEPDIFLEAAKDLNVLPGEAAILEDSLAGIKAGLAGNFKIVVGVARNNNEKQLLDRGAHVAVDDIRKLDF